MIVTYAALSSLPGVSGVSVGRRSDKTTWRVDFTPDATDDQKSGAYAALALCDIDATVATADDVRAEAQRRIMVLIGARDFNSCMTKQLNALMRATELTRKKATEGLTQGETTEALGLQQMADAVKAIRAFSNVMEPNPPADYKDDAHWRVKS